MIVHQTQIAPARNQTEQLLLRGKRGIFPRMSGDQITVSGLKTDCPQFPVERHRFVFGTVQQDQQPAAAGKKEMLVRRCRFPVGKIKTAETEIRQQTGNGLFQFFFHGWH